MNWILLSTLCVAWGAPDKQPDLPILKGIKRVVFLGDSITYSGQYIDYIEAVLVTRFPNQHYELIDLGLPSETVSGLSEPGHAGGQFERP